MPLYEYLCESCGERTEYLQRFGDAPEVVCPKCGGKMRKLPSAPSFQFKGSGFYQTDYGRKSGGAEGSPEHGAPDKSGDKAGDKSGEKTRDSTRDKSDSPGDISGVVRDSPPSPSAESAPAKASPAAPAAPAARKPASSGGE